MTYKPIRKHYKVKPKRRALNTLSARWWRGKVFWTIMLMAVICGVAAYNIFFSPFFQIGEVMISGNEKIALADLRNGITPLLSKNVFFFSTANIFLLSPAEIERTLAEKFPSLAQVKVKRKWPDSIEISVQERQAAAVWCKESVCFSMDKNGVIFEEVSGPDISGGPASPISKYREAGLPDASDRLFIRDLTHTEELFLGKQVLSGEQMEAIILLRDAFQNELQTDVSEVILASPERINVLTSEGWEAYFNFPVDNLGWQVTRLKVVLSEEIPIERRPELEYVDLRFSKIYYRYAN